MAGANKPSTSRWFALRWTAAFAGVRQTSDRNREFRQRARGGRVSPTVGREQMPRPVRLRPSPSTTASRRSPSPRAGRNWVARCSGAPVAPPPPCCVWSPSPPSGEQLGCALYIESGRVRRTPKTPGDVSVAGGRSRYREDRCRRLHARGNGGSGAGISRAASARPAATGWPAPALRSMPGRGSAPWRARSIPTRSRCLRCGCALPAGSTRWWSGC